MSTLAENVLTTGAENRPPMLEKGEYDTWQSRMLLSNLTATYKAILASSSEVPSVLEFLQRRKLEAKKDVRGDPDSGIGGHWRSSDSGMYKFILILRALAVFRFRRALAVFRFRHAFTKNGIACIYLEGHRLRSCDYLKFSICDAYTSVVQFVFAVAAVYTSWYSVRSILHMVGTWHCMRAEAMVGFEFPALPYYKIHVAIETQTASPSFGLSLGGSLILD
ncbi:hypothetical protein Tco_0598068 [Tanacetum coccineum]